MRYYQYENHTAINKNILKNRFSTSHTQQKAYCGPTASILYWIKGLKHSKHLMLVDCWDWLF